MTVLTMAWALKKAAVPDDPLAHLVLIGLADHADDDGTGAFPSVRTLASYARCTTRTVQAKLRVLEAVCLIRRGDQRLVERLPANRRPVVWDLVMDGEDHAPVALHAVGGGSVPPAAAGEPSGVSAAQPGVKILHPKNDPVDDRDRGVKPGSPQSDPAVDNSEPGVSAGSSLGASWGEAPRRPGVNASSYKPPLEELLHGSPSWTSTGSVVHSQSGARSDRCAAHQHLAVPVPCWECRDVRVASEAAVATRLTGLSHVDGLPVGGVCEHGGDGGLRVDGTPACPSCRRGLVAGVAPWDAEPVRALGSAGAGAPEQRAAAARSTP